MRNQQHYFSIGAVNVSLRSQCRSFINEYRSIYSMYECEFEQENSVSVNIHSRYRLPWSMGPYTLRSKDMDDFHIDRRYEVLPHLEWYINGHIIKNQNQYIQLHASSIEQDGQVMILPGSPGSGKTTLTAGMLTRGWSYLCDEFALIDSSSHMVHPYPRALCIKEPSFAVMDRLNLPMCRKTPYQKATKGRVAFLQPVEYKKDIIGKAGLIRWIVFPKYIADTQPMLQPMTRAEALYCLSQQCFNIQVHQQHAFEALTSIVRNALCYRLISGDIHATCDMVQHMVKNQRDKQARSA